MSWAKTVEKSTVESGSRWLFWHLPSPMLIQARFWHSKLRRICYLTWSTKHKLDSSGFVWGKYTLDSSAKPCVIGNLLALHIIGIRDLRVVLPLVLQWPQKYISHWISRYRNQDAWTKKNVAYRIGILLRYLEYYVKNTSIAVWSLSKSQAPNNNDIFLVIPKKFHGFSFRRSDELCHLGNTWMVPCGTYRHRAVSQGPSGFSQEGRWLEGS